MSMNRKTQQNDTFRMCFIGLMAAIVFVVNYFRIPFMGTQLHMTNALCALCGLLFGPGAGFMAAGLGSGLYDIVAGWGAECIVTFVNKGAIALIAGVIGYAHARREPLTTAARVRIVVGSALGALTYVALYLLKTLIFGLTVDGLTMDAVTVKILSKLPQTQTNRIHHVAFSKIAVEAKIDALPC